MKRIKALGALAVVLILAAALLVAPASAGKKKKRKVPATPEIPANILPASLQVPPEAEALIAHVEPGEALAIVAAFLELTPDQVSALVTLLQQRHEAIVPLIEEIHARQEQIREQLESGDPDPTLIGQLVIEIYDLLQQVHQVQATFMEAFLNLLNEEQQQRYQAIQLADQLQRFLPAFRTLRLI